MAVNPQAVAMAREDTERGLYLGVGGGGGLASKRGIEGGVRRRLASRTLVLGNRANARSLASSGVVQSL